jgi:hypothetical protein
MKIVFRALMLAALAAAAPATAWAQASITGFVKDTSGAVLPGVTVDAASPALIEKVRTAVTDSTGQYRIEDLRPGTYTVTFKLPGFSTVQRQGIELTGTFAAKIDAELRVGAVAETITVTGETPVVDVVNARKQSTVSNEVINAIPSARLYHSLVTLVPGVSVSGTQDVGGISGPTTVTFSMRGGPGNEGRLTVDGLSLGASLNGTGVSYTVADVGNAAEIVFTTAGQLGESEVGGPSMNLVPRQGGNRFSGLFFVNGANDSFASTNYTPELKAAGLPAPVNLLKIWDVNAGIGGPILHDRLWFFSAARYQGNRKTAPINLNANADDPTKWTYVSSGQGSVDDGTWKNANVRLTWQASEKNKFNFFWDEQRLCTSCFTGGTATVAPEAHYNNHAPPRVQQATWSSPRTNRLLLEAGVGTNFIDDYGTRPNVSNYAQLIPVVEGCFAGCANNGGIPGLAYRSTATVPFVGAYSADSDVANWRAAVSWITGRNSLKVGYIGQQIVNHFANVTMNDRWLGYTFSNGVPFSFTQYAGPAMQNTHVRTGALYLQDQWTRGRLTLSGAVRYDHSGSFFPEQTIGPNPYIPVQKVVPRADGTTYNDLTPRAALAYDVFGNGRTAVKVNVGKYLAAADGSSITGGLTNPLSRLQTNSGARTWIDANGNYAVDCNLNSMAAQDLRVSGGDFCGAGNANFGNLNTPTTTYDPAILNGWGLRPYDWNFGVQVQQQVLPRVSVDVGYFRRVFGNFFATDNRSQNDFAQFQVTAPSDPRLPNGGGQTITLYDVDPAQFGRIDNFVTKSDNFGKQTQHWNGVEVNVSARIRQGLFLQGGSSTGRTTTDNCEIRAKLPEVVFSTSGLNPYCHVEPPFKTQVKGLASYTVPKIDVVVSTTFQSLPGSTLAANYAYSNASLQPILGRPLAGNAQNLRVNLVAPGLVYGDRINQIDLRVGKLVRFGGMRTQFSVDLYNALNSNAVQTYNQTYILNGSWLAPTAILPARFAKLTAQIDF